MLFGGEVEPSDVSKGSEDTRLGRGQLTRLRRFAIIPIVRGVIPSHIDFPFLVWARGGLR